jgi:uncharacterized OB-fold protein
MHADFPLPDTTWEPLREFWAGAERHELMVPRCDACGFLCWYPKKSCPVCGGSSMPWTSVSGRGSLFSWTVVRQAFLRQFREKVPYATGLVALEEDPAVRMATTLVDCEPDQLDFGLAMEVVWRPISFEGIEKRVTAPLWRPVGTRGAPEL